MFEMAGECFWCKSKEDIKTFHLSFCERSDKSFFGNLINHNRGLCKTCYYSTASPIADLFKDIDTSMADTAFSLPIWSGPLGMYTPPPGFWYDEKANSEWIEKFHKS